MTNRTPNDLLRVMKKKGYKIFRGAQNPNIIAERSAVSKSNKFDDTLHVLYQDFSGIWFAYSFPITTDPGKYWLKNPMNPDGTLIMLPGQYLKAYKLGIHGRGKWWGYQALEQVNPMLYVRDNDQDTEIDWSLFNDVKNYVRGIFKTNIHRASKYKIVQLVERYSAGCQVFQSPKDWDNFMRLIVHSSTAWGDRYSYTLLDEKDFYD